MKTGGALHVTCSTPPVLAPPFVLLFSQPPSLLAWHLTPPTPDFLRCVHAFELLPGLRQFPLPVRLHLRLFLLHHVMSAVGTEGLLGLVSYANDIRSYL